MTDKLLREGLDKMGLPYTADQVNQLQSYIDLLGQWNRAYNLTAISEPDKVVSYHILDSLAIRDWIPPQCRCLDVGTGAGLPGIPLAIMLPSTEWVLLDSNGKKTRFVQQAIAFCKLANVKVVQSRVQDYHADSSLDVIVSRAYASVEDFITSVNHLWHKNISLITMKTELSSSELEYLDSLQYQARVAPLNIPGIAEKRNLVMLKQQ